jgi:phosphotransferase system  glucose/maltose/N-acetylglucosamine-specific IIC component
MSKIKFAIIGALLGIPLSYYFQSGFVKTFSGGIGGYIKNLDTVIDHEGSLNSLLIGVVVFGLIGYLIGFILEKVK